jgi:hypothetical protein
MRGRGIIYIMIIAYGIAPRREKKRRTERETVDRVMLVDITTMFGRDKAGWNCSLLRGRRWEVTYQ